MAIDLNGSAYKWISSATSLDTFIDNVTVTYDATNSIVMIYDTESRVYKFPTVTANGDNTELSVTYTDAGGLTWSGTIFANSDSANFDVSADGLTASFTGKGATSSALGAFSSKVGTNAKFEWTLNVSTNDDGELTVTTLNDDLTEVSSATIDLTFDGSVH